MGDDREFDDLNREIIKLRLENAAYKDERDEARRLLDEISSSFDGLKGMLAAEEKGRQVELAIMAGQKEKLHESVSRLSRKVLASMGHVTKCVAAFLDYGGHRPDCGGREPCACGYAERRKELLSVLEAVRNL